MGDTTRFLSPLPLPRLAATLRICLSRKWRIRQLDTKGLSRPSLHLLVKLWGSPDAGYTAKWAAEPQGKFFRKHEGRRDILVIWSYCLEGLWRKRLPNATNILNIGCSSSIG